MNAIWLHAAMLYSEFLNMIYNTTQWGTQFDKIFPVLMVIGFFVYFLSAMLSYLLLAIEQTRLIEQRALQSQLKASQAELRFLKATIHPHFLFNSLTALGTLTRTSTEKAQIVCQQLADFLRYSLTFSNKDFVTINEELNHINNFLGVEKIRMGRRLQTSFTIDDALLDQKILSFSLQPLIENAIKHGIEPSLDGGTISMTIQNADEFIFINISNPKGQNGHTVESTGHGLANLKSRLSKTYKDEAKILIHDGEKAFSVKLYLPRTEKS
jgi:LytS/YehU family sensor histidine kinase